MSEKLTIIGNKRVGKRSTFQTKIVNNLYDARLRWTRLLDIRRVERCVCFWFSWLSRPTSLSIVVTFSFLSTFMLQSATFMPFVGASRFPSLLSNVSSPSLSRYIFENSVGILRQLY